MEEIYISEESFAYQSLQNFLLKFPNEEACLSVFPAVCKACGRKSKSTERVFECSKCKTKTSRTAGTYFHGLRKLLPTFAWIWLHEDRAVLSINKFAELFRVRYATAWKINAKMQAVLEKEMDKHDVFELVSTVFNQVICKRSGLSTGGEHPSYEEEDEQPDIEDLEDLDEDQQALCAVLTTQPIVFDDLLQTSGLPIAKFAAALASIELEGIATRHAGNKFSLTKKDPVLLIGSQEKEVLQQFFRYVKNFHRISRKYLQRYLASFWTRSGRNRWSKGTLLNSCMKFRRLSYAEILAYNSPKMLRIPCPS